MLMRVLTDLRWEKGFFIFALISTCFAEGPSAAAPAIAPAATPVPGNSSATNNHILLTKTINKGLPGEMFYTFLFAEKFYGSVAALKKVHETTHFETYCKKADIKSSKDRKACIINPTGKSIMCVVTDSWEDLSKCKSTGDKYSIPKDDRRSQYKAILAVRHFNGKNYVKSDKGLSTGVTVTSPMEREVLAAGTKDHILFSTPEILGFQKEVAEKNDSIPVHYTLLKPRFDCDATVIERLSGKNSLPKLEIDVKCQENKDPKAIAEMVIVKQWSSCYWIRRPLPFPGKNYFTMRSECTPSQIIDTAKSPTTMSGDSSAAYPQTEPDPGILQEGIINQKLSPENLFVFTQTIKFFGDNPQRAPVSEIFIQESNCKSADASRLQKGTDSCEPLDNGKVAVCKYTNSIQDISCKFTGDKYEIAPDDRRSIHFAVAAAYQHKHGEMEAGAPSYDDFDNLVVTSPVQTEVTNFGTKSIVHFSTKEGKYVAVPSHDPNIKKPVAYQFVATKPRVDCEAVINCPVLGAPTLDKTVGLKCVDSKEPLPKRKDHEEFGYLLNFRDSYLEIYQLKYQDFEKSPELHFNLKANTEKDPSLAGNRLRTMAADDDDSASEIENDKKIAKEIERELNQQFAKDFLFKYTNRSWEKFTTLKGVEKRSVESMYQESNCKKVEAKDIESCDINPSGKIAICPHPAVKDCKFTGDKYQIDKTDVRASMADSGAAREFSKKNYQNNSDVQLEAVELLSPLQREILINGYQEKFKFKAEEVKCAKEGGKANVKCTPIKENIECDAGVIYTLQYHGPKVLSLKKEYDVKCPGMSVVTTMSADDALGTLASSSEPKETILQKRGKAHESKLNKEFAKDFLFAFITDTFNHRSTISAQNETSVRYEQHVTTENLFQETICKVGEGKDVKLCAINPAGKLALCILPDVQNCKFTGNKYELNSRRNALVIHALRNFNIQNYGVNSTKTVSEEILDSPIQREILANGIKDIFKLTANETNCVDKFDAAENETLTHCNVTKSGIHCEGSVTRIIDMTAPKKMKKEEVFTCPGHVVTPRSGVADMKSKKRSGSGKKRQTSKVQRKNKKNHSE